MINDFLNFCLMQTIHCLTDFIVVYQNDFLFIHFKKTVTCHHPHQSSLTVKNRIISVTHFCHNASDIFCIIVRSEISQIIPDHKIADWNTLVQKSGSDKCIIGCTKNDAVFFFCQLQNRW